MHLRNFAIFTILLFYTLIASGTEKIEQIQLKNINIIDGKFRIVNNEQYLCFDNYNDTLCFYVARSLTYEIEAVSKPFTIFFFNLYDGRFRIENFSMYPSDFEINYNKLIENLKHNKPISCFPSIFYKTLKPKEKFTINLIFPDIFDLKTIEKMIVIFPQSILNVCPPFQIRSSSINISFANQLIYYAKTIFERFSKLSVDNNVGFLECPIIPWEMTDEFSSQKEYYLSISKYYELSVKRMKNL